MALLLLTCCVSNKPTTNGLIAEAYQKVSMALLLLSMMMHLYVACERALGS